MTWNHRIVSIIDEIGDEFFEIAEVFYDSDGEPYAYGQATISADDIEGIYAQLEWFNAADTKPILKYPEHFTGDVNK
jgi:hypothetical protein